MGKGTEETKSESPTEKSILKKSGSESNKSNEDDNTQGKVRRTVVFKEEDAIEPPKTAVDDTSVPEKGKNKNKDKDRGFFSLKWKRDKKRVNLNEVAAMLAAQSPDTNSNNNSTNTKEVQESDSNGETTNDNNSGSRPSIKRTVTSPAAQSIRDLYKSLQESENTKNPETNNPEQNPTPDTKPETQTSSKKERRGSTKLVLIECPKCATQNINSAYMCKHCGSKLRQSNNNNSNPSSPSKPNTTGYRQSVAVPVTAFTEDAKGEWMAKLQKIKNKHNAPQAPSTSPSKEILSTSPSKELASTSPSKQNTELLKEKKALPEPPKKKDSKKKDKKDKSKKQSTKKEPTVTKALPTPPEKTPATPKAESPKASADPMRDSVDSTRSESDDNVISRPRAPSVDYDNLIGSLCALQGKDGSFKLSEQLAKLIGLPNMEAIMGSVKSEAENRLIATSLVMTFLNQYHSLEGEAYQTIVEKANEWISETQYRTVSLPNIAQIKANRLHMKTVQRHQDIIHKNADVPVDLETDNEDSNMIRTRVVAAEQRDGATQSTTVYRIDVSMDNNNYQWAVFRRYKQFSDLHDTLVELQLIEKDKVKLPSGQSGIFGSRSDFIKKRVEQLDKYLTQVLTSPKIQATGYTYVTQFLAPRHVGDIAYDGKELTLESLMDEKWTRILNLLHKAVGGNEAAKTTVSPAPQAVTEPVVEPSTSEQELTKPKQTPASQSVRTATVNISPLQATTPTPSPNPQRSSSEERKTYKKRLSFWEKVFQNDTDSDAYSPPTLTINAQPPFLPSEVPASDNDRFLVAWEMYTSERNYCRTLEIIRNIFVDPLKNPTSPYFGIFSEEEVKELFPVIDELKSFHFMMMYDLERKLLNWSPKQCVGDTLIKYVPFFKMYSQYCKNYDKSNSKLMQAMKLEEFDKFIKETFESSDDVTLPDLQSYLIQPVQRLPKVMLLLSELLKRTPPSHSDHDNLQKTLNQVKTIIDNINESIRHAERAFQFWQESPVVSSLMEATRIPIHKDNVLVKDMRTNNDMFVITKDSIIVDKLSLECTWILRDNPNINGFELITPERHYRLQAATNQQYVNQLQWENVLLLQIDKNTKQNSEGLRICNSFYTYSNGDKYKGSWKDFKRHGKGTFEWSNGNSFTGDWCDDKMNGLGVLLMSSGDKYEGGFRNNKPHGYGQLVNASGSIYSGNWSEGLREGKGKLFFNTSLDYYDGDWKENVFDGHGELILGDGSFYKGQWKAGKRHGYGVAQINGCTYEGFPFLVSSHSAGEWKSDRKEGKGKLTYSNHEYYDGFFKDDLRHGQGIFHSLVAIYDGEWIRGLREGHGVLTYKDGSYCYAGSWKTDTRHGEGKMTLNNVGYYEGNWVNDLRDGKGIMKYSNGDVYDGYWKEDKRHGNGKLITTEGTYDGNFVANKKEGEGSMIFADKKRYYGQWVDDCRNGKGILVFPDGSKYDGEWKDDKKHGKGTFTDKTGKYTGGWKEDRQHGKGQFISIVDNSVFEGEWVTGNRHGKGILKFYDGSSLEQNWISGSLDTPVFGLLGSPVLPTLNTFIL